MNAAGERQFLLLSYDLAHNICVLEAKLHFRGEARADYYIDDNGALPVDERNLVLRHFERLHLAHRYAKRAQGLLSAMKAELGGRSRKIARRIVQGGLDAIAATDPINGWQPALYRAMNRDLNGFLDWLR